MNTPTINEANANVVHAHTKTCKYRIEETDGQKVLNNLSKNIECFTPTMWKHKCDELNEGIAGTPIPYKDAYKIIFIESLKQFASQQNIMFAKDGSLFYIYNEEYWVKISEDLIKEFLYTAAQKIGLPKSLALCVKFNKAAYEQLLESGFYRKMTQSYITYLNLLNGTLKISANGVELEEFNPKHFSTHQLNFAYDKNARNQDWLDFLDTAIPDKDTQKTLQQSIGYLFIRDLKLEKVFFLFGTGSNGKSVVFEIIKGLLAPDMMTNYSLVSLTNKLGYQLADLNYKLINYGSDASMKNVDPAIFKQIVSGEPIGTRQIREKAFTMKHYAKLIFNVNKITDADIENTHGFFRRIVFIPFDVTIPKEKQDKKLHKKILQNKAGVLNWIIKGIEEVIKNEEIYMSEKCENFLENFKKEASPIQLFISVSGLIKKDKGSKEVIGNQELYDLYREFCKKQGEKPTTQRAFNADLKLLGFESIRRNRGWVWFAKIQTMHN